VREYLQEWKLGVRVPVVSATQEVEAGEEFEASLVYIVRPCFKKNL
jgi:hypothetical protein